MTSPVSAVEAIEKAMEGDTHRPLVEMIAWAMASRSVGDPQAIDMNGRPRWTWYVDEVERFVETHRYELRLFLACSLDRMREVLALARQAEALKRENAELRLGLNEIATDEEYRDLSAEEAKDMAKATLRRARTLLKEEANAE